MFKLFKINLPTKFIIGCSIFILLLNACKQSHQNMMDINAHVFRLKPGEDLKQSIQKYVNENNIAAGWVSTCVGSLTKYHIRFANQPEASSDSGHFEIVSLTGTVSVNGSHLHISLSDSTGKTIGGHLQEGNLIYTTAEIVLLSSNKYNFILSHSRFWFKHWSC